MRRCRAVGFAGTTLSHDLRMGKGGLGEGGGGAQGGLELGEGVTPPPSNFMEAQGESPSSVEERGGDTDRAHTNGQCREG